MKTKHNFVQLAEVQRAQGTMYCAGLDIHSFGGYAQNLDVYNAAIKTDEERQRYKETQKYYSDLLSFIAPGVSMEGTHFLRHIVHESIDIAGCIKQAAFLI